jgi:hypothetical protein
MSKFLQISVGLQQLSCLAILMLSSLSLYAQIPDSISNINPSPSNFAKIDTLRPPLDTLSPPKFKETKAIKISEDALEELIEYSAEDSMRLDAVNKVVYLYGKANVKYTTIELTAGKIIFDLENDIVEAEFILDSLGRKSEKPIFKEGSTEPITADRMRYNFVTKKGKIYNTTSSQAGGYITSSEAKIVGKIDSVPNSSDIIYGQNAIYTTCDHEHKHYGLRSKQQKIIPQKLVVVGPSNIEIMGIPTPLWLPFGFFPLTEGQSGGLIFPKDYEYSPQWGYGLRNVGWYVGVNEYMDLQLVGDIYTRGSFGLRALSSYRKRYQYNGNFQLGYSRRVQGDPVADGIAPKNAYTIKWSHSQDSKAHPYRTFRASVNIETNNFQRDNFNDANSVLNSNLNSSVYFTRQFPGKPFSFSASLGHSQNVNTHDITLNLPMFDFNMRRVFPFQRKNPVGEEKWFEKIGVTYTGKIQNTITGKDTLLFEPDQLDFRYGANHSIPISANFKILKYFNIAPSINYSEQWFLNTLRKEFDPTLTVTYDTTFDANKEPIDITTDTSFGQVIDITENGFKSLRQLNGSVSLNTKLFGMVNFKRGPIKAIRHTATPSLSYTYTPDYTNGFLDYWDEVQVDTRYPDEFLEYTYFANGLFGSATRGGSQSMSYNISNILEAKVFDRSDTTNQFKKIQILKTLNIAGNYDFDADSLKMSVFTVNGSTTILKKINVNFGMTLDPLAANPYTNTRIDTYEWMANQRLARMTSARVSANARLNSAFFEEVFGINKDKPKVEKPKPPSRDNDENELGSPFSFLQDLSVNYNLAVSNKYFDGVDSTFITQNNISVSGGTVNLSSKWKITIGGVGYDFVRNTFTYPDFRFQRDLHCWEMGMSWQPQRGTYSFYIRVKQPSQLDFLNLPYKRNNYDVLGGF